MSEEYEIQWQAMFHAAVKASGGTLTVDVEDYNNPPRIGSEGINPDNTITFVLLGEDDE